MLNKDAVQIIKPLLNEHGKDHETLVAEALKEGVLEELLDLAYETGTKISPAVVLKQLEAHYCKQIPSSKEKTQQANKISYLINKYQYLLMKTTFDDKK
jgi:hypothetical protein